MYTKVEASFLRQTFWTSFGQYMSPVPSASGEKVNWINYKTGIKGIFFKMDADKSSAMVAVEIILADKVLQNEYFSIFTKFVKQFKEIAGAEWTMEKHYTNEYHQSLSRIFIEIKDVNIFNKNDWPAIISFLKKNVISLDAFWDEYKPAFETL